MKIQHPIGLPYGLYYDLYDTGNNEPFEFPELRLHKSMIYSLRM